MPGRDAHGQGRRTPGGRRAIRRSTEQFIRTIRRSIEQFIRKNAKIHRPALVFFLRSMVFFFFFFFFCVLIEEATPT